MLLENLKGHNDVLKTLVENDADVHLEDERGQKALLLATIHRDNDVVKLFV